MKQSWRRLAAKLDTRNPRERALIFVMVIVVTVAIFNMALFDPLSAKTKRLTLELKQHETQLVDIATRIQVMEQSGQSDPDAPTRARLAVVEQRLAQAATELQSTQQSLVEPDKMAKLLEDMLSQNRNLTLIALKTLPASGLLDTPESKSATGDGKGAVTAGQARSPGPAIYKHGVEITVAGSYADLTQYLDALENLPWHMFWGKVEMRVEEHPRVILTITVYTLSMDRTWLAI